MNSPDLTRLASQRQSDLDSLRRLARAIVGEEQADDVVQDAWAAALAHRGNAPDNWPGWMMRVTQRLAWKRRMQAHNRVDREREAALRAASMGDEPKGGASAGRAPDELIAEIEEKQALERALLELDDPYRSALLWRYYEDLPLAEVARRAGCSASTTRTHVQRGLERLRRKLEEERGSDWRAGLLPLLLPASGALPQGAGGVLGASMVGAAKVGALALAAVLLAWVGVSYGLKRLEPIDLPAGIQVTAGGVRSAAQSGPEQLDSPPAPDADSYEERSVSAPLEIRRSESVEGERVAASSAREATGTVARLVERSTGLPLIGVRVTLRYSKIRKVLFFGRTETREQQLLADDRGLIALPCELDSAGKSADNELRFKFHLGPAPHLDPSCVFAGFGEDGVANFAVDSVLCSWIRLEEQLSAEESAELSGVWMSENPRGNKELHGFRLSPAAVRGQDVLFLLPYLPHAHPDMHERETRLVVATTPRGRSFEASLPGGVNLATPPLPARRADHMTHTFQVIDAGTGMPQVGVMVGVSAGSATSVSSSSYLPPLSLGQTDSSGTAVLIGIPRGPVTVSVHVDGYERYRSTKELSPGGQTSVVLVRKAGLREVELTLSAAAGNPPTRIGFRVIEGELGSTVLRQSGAEPRRSGDGWRLKQAIKNVPAGLCFLVLDLYPASYSTPAFLRLEPGQRSLEVELGDELELVPVVLNLPEGIQARVNYRMGTGEGGFGPLTGLGGDLSNGATALSLPADDRALIWMVDVPGYVPVLGTKSDLRPFDFQGKACLELRPQLRKGWGSIVGAFERWEPADLPFALWEAPPITGVTVRDVASGLVLGVTDVHGYALIEASTPVAEIIGRHGSVERSFALDGATRFTLGF